MHECHSSYALEVVDINHNRQQNYLNPLNADCSLWQLLDSQWEEQGDRELDCAIEGHSDKHTASSDGVAQKSVDGEGYEDDDLAACKEGSYVESS